MALIYTNEHEWLSIEDGVATIGITDYAQEQLGDVVFVELPEVGAKVDAGGDAAVVESVKAASEVYAPVDGEVVEVNSSLEDDPSQVNNNATGDGWFFKIKMSDASQTNDMMDEAGYKTYIEGLE